MSISDKLNAVLTTKNAIKQALINKGQEVGDVFSEYPQIIENMEVGGSGGNNEIWTPNPDWPDIEKILLETPLVEGSKGSCIILIPAGGKVLKWEEFGSTSYFSNIIGMQLSDGAYYKIPSTPRDLQHAWDETKDFVSPEGNKYRWIIFFTTHSSVFDLQRANWKGTEPTFPLNYLKYIVMNNCRMQFIYSYRYSLECIKSVQPITIYIQNLSGFFNGCRSLVCTKNITWGDGVECTGNNLFSGCNNLKEVPSINPKLKFKNVSQMFDNCYKIQKYPKINCTNGVLGIGQMYCNATGGSSTGSNMNWATDNIEWATKIFNENLYLQCFYNISPESFYKLVENMATLSSGQSANTIYFSKYFFNQVMTEEQKTAITKKGWNISTK